MISSNFRRIVPKVVMLSFSTILCIVGCGTTNLVTKAIIEPKHVESAIRIGQEIDSTGELESTEVDRWFEICIGNLPIIVTAPHASRPYREGAKRFSDGGATAAVARMLHDLAGVSAIYTTHASPSDPNFYDTNAFKDSLGVLLGRIRPILVLDIHGSHALRPYDIDIGTMDGQSLLGRKKLFSTLRQCLSTAGFGSISVNYFSASKNQTITKYCALHGVPAIQLEVSSTRLCPSSGNIEGHLFAQLLDGLVRYVKLIGNEPGPPKK